jgi:hypothetical protein
MNTGSDYFFDRTGVQKLIGDLLDSEIARSFVVLQVPQNRLWHS